MKIDEELLKVSQELKEVISEYQKKHELSFVEDTHTYYMKDKNGNIRNNAPSVSTVLHLFYNSFIPEETKSFQNCGGDPIKEKELLDSWQATADYSVNKGSSVHYELESEIIKRYGSYKTVRKPIFECDEQQNREANEMIKAGINFIELMHERGAVLLDTECVMGDIDGDINGNGYFGQADNFYIIRTKNNELGFLITDYKTNKPKNFEVHHYTKQMLEPFQNYPDTAKSHYYIQIPLYARLMKAMLKGSKFEYMPFLGGIIALLKDDGTFEEHRIPKDVIDKVFSMNIMEQLKKNNLLIKPENH